MKKNKSRSILIIALILTLITSCNKDVIIDSEISIITTVNEESQAAAINECIVSVVDKYVSTYNFVNQTLNDQLPVITVSPNDSITFPKTFILDFGNTGFTGISGIILKGKIIAQVNDKIWKSNIHKVVTFDHFYVDNNKISGTDTIKTTGSYSINNPITIIVANDTISRTDETKTTWKSYRIRTLIDDGGTTELNDDKFSITGSSNGVNMIGVPYATFVTPTNPLIWFNNYTFYVQGSVTVATERKIALIDFGAGLLDDQAIISIDNIPNIITLKK